MWEYIKQLFKDYYAYENELVKNGIFRVYGPYGVIDYYELPEKKDSNESKEKTLV